MSFKKTIVLLFYISNFAFAQYNLNYFLSKAQSNSPLLKEYSNLYSINKLQNKLDIAQNSAFQVSLSSNLLFSPYFNNNGVLFTPNPGPNAIGYDAATTNGGLYSAQINFGKNIFNSGILDILNRQRLVQGKSYENKSYEEKHNLEKQVTDQFLNTLQYLLLYNLSKNIENNLNKQLIITRNQVEKGFSKASDYLQLKIEVKTQLIELQQEWQNYKSGISQLYSICGIKDTETVKLDTVILTMNQTNIKSNFLNQFYYDSLSAVIQQSVFETKYQPLFSVFFNAGLNAVELNNIQRKFGVSAGINFSLPILDGGQKNITRQQTAISENSISDYKNYLEKNIFTKRKDSENKIILLKKNIVDQKEQISDYIKLLNISEDQLEKGNLSMIEYLTLLRNFISLQKNEITTEINYQLEISNYNYWNW